MTCASAWFGPLTGLRLLATFVAMSTLTSCADLVAEPVGDANAALLGLCEPCTRSASCGDANDFCLVTSLHPQPFCSRDCEEAGQCPEGYQCSGVSGAGSPQCVPTVGNCGAERGANLASDTLRAELAIAVRELRSERQLSALTPDACLTELAQASVDDLVKTGVPLQVFERQCASPGTTCPCQARSERQIQLASYELDAIAALRASLDGAGSVAVTSEEAAPDAEGYTRFGTGVRQLGDELFVSLVFGD